jgi:hypothetical protein
LKLILLKTSFFLDEKERVIDLETLYSVIYDAVLMANLKEKAFLMRNNYSQKSNSDITFLQKQLNIL